VPEVSIQGFCYKGTAFAISKMPEDIPIASFVITQEGQVCGLWKEPEYRRISEINTMWIQMVQKALKAGVLQVEGDEIWGLVHPTNSASNDWSTTFRVGGSLSTITKDNVVWNRWAVPVKDLLESDNGG